MATDFMKLKASLSLNSSEYEKGLDESEKKASKFAGVAKAAFAVGAAAVTTATVAVGALAKKSIDAYANYEQLAGGVKKLYGSAADELMTYANDAYKTSGMSANQYMEQATSFSAALINSLGGDVSAAAKRTDVAMQAIADNFNTFGGDITMIQGAFQGFAKQNYTMLDNLKLGYGGTKTEMERLIADANAYAAANGKAADLSINSFADIVTAIDLIQQKQGIAGATAKEAATTIEGSLNMTKAAWENLVAGFANPDADLGKLMDNLVVAIVGDKKGEGLLNQIIPAIERALNGIGQLLDKAVPILTEHFPKIVSSVLPSLLSAATNLIAGLVTALPELIQVIVAQMPMIITTLIQALTDALPMLIEFAPTLILTLAEGISNSLPTLIPAMVDAILTMTDALISNIDKLIEAAFLLIRGLAEGLIKAIPMLVSHIPTIIASVFTGLLNGAGKMLEAGIRLVGRLADGFSDSTRELKQQIVSWVQGIPNAIIRGIGSLYNIGRDIINGLWDGIQDAFDSLIDWVYEAITFIPDLFMDLLGIASPSKVFMGIGKWIPEGLAIGMEDNMDAVTDATNAMADETLFMPEEQEIELSGFERSVESVAPVINIYPTPQQDARQIAEEVQKQLVTWERQRKKAFA